MSYQQWMTSKNPGCFIFLIDQSGSMDEILAGSTRKKSDCVADAINKLLQTLVLKCTETNGVRERCEVGVFGYGANTGPCFGGVLAGRTLVPISQVKANPTRLEKRTKKVDDGAGGLVDTTVTFPVWFDSVANGGTPMFEAMQMARRTLESWLPGHPDAYPPIVINITDGEHTGSDPATEATALTGLSTSDGNVLLFNCHISKNGGAELLFMDSEDNLPDDLARKLFRMSSLLPAQMRAVAGAMDVKLSDTARGCAINADLATLITFIEIGSGGANMR